MPETVFQGRKAVCIENDALRVTVLKEGGHLAEIFDKRVGVSPLWIPRWTSIEPSVYTTETHPEFGSGAEARLLAGIMGHNLCLDIFGGPSPEEEAVGYTAHGEASIVTYALTADGSKMEARAHLSLAQLDVTRSIALHGSQVCVHEEIENLAAFDRPIGWTEHVTLGPPFLDEETEFQASMTRSLAFEGFGLHDYIEADGEFVWPMANRSGGGSVDLRRIGSAPSSGYTAHLADRSSKEAYFVAYSKQYQLAFGYVWKRQDFPWMGIWEENHSRQGAPWNGDEVTRGMEFGVSLFPESRQRMVARGRVFNTPAFGWLPARGKRQVEYWISSMQTDRIPEALHWPKDVT